MLDIWAMLHSVEEPTTEGDSFEDFRHLLFRGFVVGELQRRDGFME